MFANLRKRVTRLPPILPAQPGAAATRPPVMNDDALFHSPEQAVRFAYRVESMDIVKISTYFQNLRGSTVKLRRPTGPWETHAQSALILVMLERTLKPSELLAIRAHYTHPTSLNLELRKAKDCWKLMEYLNELRVMPKAYVLDASRGWAGYRREKTDEEWSRRLSVHINTLYHYRCGIARSQWLGISRTLDNLEIAGMADLHLPMTAAGLID